MTDLRTAAQQALEAMRFALHVGFDESSESQIKKADKASRQHWSAIRAIEAALAQQAEPVDTDCHTQGICQRSGYGITQQAEPVEPVAWLYTGIKQDGTEHGPHLVWKPEYMDAMSASKGAKATPLYFAPPRQAEPVEPVGQLAELQAMLRAEVDRLVAAGIQPQRKPLTEEEIEACRQQGYAHAGLSAPFDFGKAARAVERAHGIADPQIVDRLARHGIPMPGDPK